MLFLLSDSSVTFHSLILVSLYWHLHQNTCYQKYAWPLPYTLSIDIHIGGAYSQTNLQLTHYVPAAFRDQMWYNTDVLIIQWRAIKHVKKRLIIYTAWHFAHQKERRWGMLGLVKPVIDYPNMKRQHDSPVDCPWWPGGHTVFAWIDIWLGWQHNGTERLYFFWLFKVIVLNLSDFFPLSDREWREEERKCEETRDGRREWRKETGRHNLYASACNNQSSQVFFQANSQFPSVH